MTTKLKDPGTERALVGTIIKNGRDAFIDADSILDSSDFALPLNNVIYRCIGSLSDDDNCETFDSESIRLKAKALGLEEYFTGHKESEYLELLDSSNFESDNIQLFAYQIKKLSIVRSLKGRYESALNYLGNVDTNEKLSTILSKAESEVVDYINGVDNSEAWSNLSVGLTERVEELLSMKPVDQVGIPTGFPKWDDAIGGGPRPGTISVIGARSKKGKSFLGLNMALNIAHKGIPVLYLDTELTEPYQQSRMICIDSRCPLKSYETGGFQSSSELIDSVRNSASSLENTLPLYYRSIAGANHTEAMSIARRWLVKEVGFNEQGRANDCLIIYDYLKLTSGEQLSSFTPEYIVLGLMLTEMHNFAVKYDVPIVGLVQLNRDGIDGDDTNVIAGSDRILWLCSSLSIFKDKDEEDAALGCGWEQGNKKLGILATRHGGGLEVENDYINLHASLNPHIAKSEATGLITEGLLFSEVSTGPTEESQQRDT